MSFPARTTTAEIELGKTLQPKFGPDGLILTIGYLILEADSIQVTTHDNRVIPAQPVGYDLATGFGLVRTLLPLRGIAPVEVVVKQFRNRGTRDRLRRRLQGSKAEKSWRVARALLDRSEARTQRRRGGDVDATRLAARKDRDPRRHRGRRAQQVAPPPSDSAARPSSTGFPASSKSCSPIGPASPRA